MAYFVLDPESVTVFKKDTIPAFADIKQMPFLCY